MRCGTTKATPAATIISTNDGTLVLDNTGIHQQTKQVVRPTASSSTKLTGSYEKVQLDTTNQSNIAIVLGGWVLAGGQELGFAVDWLARHVGCPSPRRSTWMMGVWN